MAGSEKLCIQTYQSKADIMAPTTAALMQNVFTIFANINEPGKVAGPLRTESKKFWVKPGEILNKRKERKEERRKIIAMKVLQAAIYIVCLFVLVLLLIVRVRINIFIVHYIFRKYRVSTVQSKVVQLRKI
jgi:sugar phosphate permease